MTYVTTRFPEPSGYQTWRSRSSWLCVLASPDCRTQGRGMLGRLDGIRFLLHVNRCLLSKIRKWNERSVCLELISNPALSASEWRPPFSLPSSTYVVVPREPSTANLSCPD